MLLSTFLFRSLNISNPRKALKVFSKWIKFCKHKVNLLCLIRGETIENKSIKCLIRGWKVSVWAEWKTLRTLKYLKFIVQHRSMDSTFFWLWAVEIKNLRFRLHDYTIIFSLNDPKWTFSRPLQFLFMTWHYLIPVSCLPETILLFARNKNSL